MRLLPCPLSGFVRFALVCLAGASFPLIEKSAAEDAAPVTPIHVIQGGGAKAKEGSYMVEGIVTGVFPELHGFFLQEEDADADNDPLTAEGIFVQSVAPLKPGQKVRAVGTVTNTYGMAR